MMDTAPLSPTPDRTGRRGKLALRPFGEGLEAILDMVFGQRLEPGTQCDLLREGQAGETNQLLVLDEDAAQGDLPARRQARCRVDRRAGFRCGVERDNDAFDLSCHQRAWVMAALCASPAVFAAKASSRAAMRWLSVPAG